MLGICIRLKKCVPSKTWERYDLIQIRHDAKGGVILNSFQNLIRP